MFEIQEMLCHNQNQAKRIDQWTLSKVIDVRAKVKNKEVTIQQVYL